MGKPKSAGLSFELLEDRCLLNGAVWQSAPGGDRAPDHDMRFMAVPAPDGAAFDGAAPWTQQAAPAEIFAMQTRFGGPGMRPFIARTAGMPFLPFINVTTPSIATVTSVVTIEISYTPSGQAPASQQVGAVEFPQRLNYAASQPPLGNAQPAAEKEPSGSAGAARESGVLPPPNSASSQSATSVSQAVARDDHAAASLALPVKSQGTGSAAPVIGLVPATTQVSAGVFQGQDGYGMAMTVTPELSHPFGSPLPFGNQYAGSEPSFLAATLVPPAALLTNVLPVDVASLESSIKDFFDQIDHAGLKLSESQLGLLFSSGTLAVAAMLALEIARRQVQRHPAPALTPRREGSIPYSDYP